MDASDPESYQSGLIGLVSVNVAQPFTIGMRRGRPVSSAIQKRPVAKAALQLNALHLEGDWQADRRVHGGLDKAVYAYPSEHLPLWAEEYGSSPPFVPGTFGENLTTAGWLETGVRVSDIWSWGEALLQVTAPRAPCFKLAMVTGCPKIVKRLTATGRTGWYLRVLREGIVPVSGPIFLVERQSESPTIFEVHRGSA